MKSAIFLPVIGSAALVAGAYLIFAPSREPAESLAAQRKVAATRAGERGGSPPRVGSDDFAKTLEQARALGSAAMTGPLAAWVAEDPAAAEAWAMTLEGAERDAALGVLVVELGSRDAVAALRVAENIAEPKVRGEALGFALAQQATRDPDATFARLEAGFGDEDIQARLEQRVLPALAESDPVRMARWISEGRTTPQATEAAVVATVQRWTQRDPQAAAQWVAAFEDPRLLRDAMQPLVALWMNGASHDAPAGWIAGLPAGAVRDEACAAYAAALESSDRDQAVRWAAEIQGPELAAEIRRRIDAEPEK